MANNCAAMGAYCQILIVIGAILMAIVSFAFRQKVNSASGITCRAYGKLTLRRQANGISQLLIDFHSSVLVWLF